MRRNIGGLTALLLAFCAVFAPRAAAQAPAVKAGSVVSIPFAPPLGQTLTYRMERARTGSGAQRQPATAEVDLLFRRAGAQFAMDVSYRFPGAPAEFARDPLFGLINPPLTFRISAEGEIVGVQNEERYWRGFEQLVEGLAANAKEAGGAEAARKTVATLQGLPAEARLAMLSQQVAPLLALSGSELTVGETIETEQEGESPVGPVLQQIRLTLERVTGDRATIVSTRVTPPSRIEAALRALIARVGGAPLGQDKLVRLERREDLDVSIRTGLSERYRSTLTVETETAGKRVTEEQVDSLERIR